jgi:uncharacterized protein YndB with AHSA1/START domain
MTDDVVTVERVIAAPPENIFALIADPAKHPLIDGSATVIATKNVPSTPLELGSKFGMSMKAGIKYSMESEVVEFEQDRRIAWQSRPPGRIGRIAGGRTWRYELEPVEGGTLVRESWDVGPDHQRRLLKLGGLPAKTKTSMEKTLARIDSILTGAEPPTS